MRNLLYSLALPFLILGLGPAAVVAEVHDEAGMFRPEAVRRADVILQRVEREQRIPVRIDTIESLRGATTPEERQEWSRKTKYEVVDRLGERRAQDWGRPGLYLLISKDDRAFSNLLVHRSLERRFPATRREAIKSLLTSAFKQSQYDEGLIRVAEQIEDVAVATANQDRAATRGHAQGPVGPPMQRQRGGGGMGIIGFLILILGIFLVIRLLSGLFGAARGGYSRPGGPMGGPGGYGGYGGGGGGGGFFSGLFGGLGGALLGNWLFDRWNYPHQDAGSSSGGVLEPTGSSEPTYAPDDFAGANDDGGQGGGWGGDAGSPGDWLGGGDGGGSDWGGGDGGGSDSGGGGW